MDQYNQTKGWINPTINQGTQTNASARTTNNQSQSNTGGFSVGGGYVKEVNPGSAPIYYGANGGAALNPSKIDVGGRTQWTAPANYNTVTSNPNYNQPSGGSGTPSSSNEKSNSNNSNPSNTNPNNNPWWIQPFAYGGPGNNFIGGNSPGGNSPYLNPYMGMMGGYGAMFGYPGMGFGGFGGGLNPYAAMFGGGYGGGMFSNPFSSFGASSGLGGGLNPYSGMYGIGNQFGNSFGGMSDGFGQDPVAAMFGQYFR